jgi:FkbM family methyltransferase
LPALLRWKKFSLASYCIVQRLKEAGVAPASIVDVGANVGQFAVAATNLMPHATLHAIEPDPATASTLRANLPPEVAARVIVSAIGEREGSVEFQVNRDSQVSSVLPLGEDRKASFPGSTVQRTMKVPMATLDGLFAAAGLASPILLKIDVQGYEDRVVAGAVGFLQQVKWVVIETAFARLYEGERDFASMLDLMREHGFRFVKPLNFHTSDVTGAIIEMDALFERV